MGHQNLHQQMTIDPDDPVSFVLAYVAARHDWEVRAQAILDNDLGSDPVGEVQSTYDALQARFCAPSLLNLGLRAVVGDPPEFDPDKTRIVASERSGDRLVVSTEETTDPILGPLEVQYILEHRDGRLLILDRRAKDGRGRWIRRVI